MSHSLVVKYFLILAAAALPAALAAGPANSIAITELRGTAQSGRPFTISRVFAQGEISGFPQPVLGGVPATLWQADVKTRWPDGTVQHALVSFQASLAANAVLTVTFVNNANPCSSGNRAACDGASLTQQQMLDFNAGSGTGSWGGRLDAAASGNKRSADVRALIAAGQWSYWLRGPVVTQAIVEDRTTALSADFGWQCTGGCSGDYSTATWAPAPSAQYNSLHPIFVTTFYSGYSGVKVEFIVENVWSNRVQDQRYSVNLYTGNPGSNLVFSKPDVTHWGLTRWRKTYWSGSTPAPVKIDHNLAYMAYSRVLPNFDLTKQVTSTGITAQLADWAASDQGAMLSPNGTMNGLWTKYLPQTGGRPEIGLFPTWVTRYLYTFHTTADGNDLYDVMISNGEVGGYVPVHVREGNPNPALKYCALSQACITAGLNNVPAFGKPSSRDANPTSDNLNPVATLSAAHGWTPDTAHQGSFAFIPYLVTGDWYFLEELNFWSANNLTRYPGGTTLFWQSHDDWCYMRDQIRGMAWVWRTLGHSALMSPDNTPEKAYFRQKLLNNIAVREGKHNIVDGYGYASDNVKWQWGYTRASAAQGDVEQTTHLNNPLNIVDFDEYADFQAIDQSKTKFIVPQWQVHMFSVVLGHLEELGFPVTKYKEAVYRHNIGQLQDPTYDPWLIGNYRSPAVMVSTNSFPATFAEMKGGYLASEQVRSTWESGDTDPDSGYPFYALAAASFYPGLSAGSYTGQGAWNWLNSRVNTAMLNENPKWAFAPRGTSPTLAISPCDLDRNGTVDTNDLVFAENEVLGLIPCTNNLTGDGQCTIVTVQRVVNAILGGTCRTGL